MAEYTEELYKKDLQDPDNHDGVFTHLEPDILEYEVKWALGSIKQTRSKLVEVIEFQLSYFKSWKMMLLKCCTQYASKFGKLSSGYKTGKGQLSFQSQRKAMSKNAPTTTQVHSSHKLVKIKILQARLQQYVNHELPDVQAGFRKGRGTRDQTDDIHWIIEKVRVPEKHILLLYWLCQSLWLCGSQQTMENSERDENTRPPPSWEICMQVRKQQLELDMEQQTSSKLG